MQIAMIENHTRVCGKSQGFLGLPIRDELVEVPGFGICNQMTTAWTPTPDELERLSKGACVHIKLLGENPTFGPLPMPMIVEVGEIPE